MQDKRFQVFISSTYEDLKAERRAVEDVIISTGDFPVQMEGFPAADEDQFEFIKSLIDQCDYYVLILAGRYGTVAENGLSYTEKEYRYAVSRGVPVLVMLHAERGRIPADKTEQTEVGKQQLDKFIAEASQGRIRKDWSTVDGLKLAVREALDHAKRTKPRIGWVRGDSVASLEVLNELNKLRKENENLKNNIGKLKINIPDLEIPNCNDEITIDINLNNISKKGYYRVSGCGAKIKCSWIGCFFVFYRNFIWHIDDHHSGYRLDEAKSCIHIGSGLASEVSGVDTGDFFKISKLTFGILFNYYIEAGLMRAEGSSEPFTESAKRFARRQSVQSIKSSEIFLIEGGVEIKEDDEIPF
ncbi:DUF4062 domain-containing protein [Kiloniella laminariae]|uniref:DUF4062 domain-containing protein n=1 Tax=Kiloniella laminariae TaxID=454162 RepID=UPI00036675E1|nr:DUF4062 domain-containing protein [Kiloniella laminariae]